MSSHYDTLGVASSASAEEIRRAYLAKARMLHPDRHAGSTAERRVQAERDMQLVNEAFEAIGDANARRRYDHDLRGSDPSEFRRSPFVPHDSAGHESGDASSDGTPDRYQSAPMFHMMRSLPLLLVLGTLGALFVFTAFASGNRFDDERRVAVISQGDCVTTAGTRMTWVPCDGSTTGIVQAIVAAEADCIARNGTTPMPMPDGDGYACLEPAGDKERP